MKITHKDRRFHDRMRSDTDRRSSQDRRSDDNISKSPFKDSDRQKVTVERRRTADRRLNNIEVEWLDEEEGCA